MYLLIKALEFLFLASILFSPVLALAVLFIPRRYLTYYLGWVGLPVLVIGFVCLLPVGNNAGIGYAMGMAIAILALALIGFALFLKLAWSFFRRAKRKNGDAAPFPLKPVSRLQAACYGGFISAPVWLMSAGYFHGFRPAWLPYLIIAGVILIISGVCRKYVSLGQARYFMVGFCGAMIALLCFSAGMSFEVVRQAELAAGGEPYCVQTVAKRADYLPAQTALDLSTLVMQDLRGYGYHAVLVTGTRQLPKFFNWSYRQNKFIPQPNATPLIYCQPQSHFGKGLPLFIADSRDDESMFYLRFMDREYRIPQAYQPQSHSYNASVSLMMKPPDFEPVLEAREAMPLNQRFTSEVTLHLNPAQEIKRCLGATAENSDSFLCKMLFFHDNIAVEFQPPVSSSGRAAVEQALAKRLDSFQVNRINH